MHKIHKYREFKISGTIDNAGETNKLRFTSLAHHIEAALAKRCTEEKSGML